MNNDDLQLLKNRFQNYVGMFHTAVQEDHRNIAVKQEHTHRVCLNATRIAGDLGLRKEESLLAETISLFHDIGRFPQYQRYKTFDDTISINHAVLGAKVIVENSMLDNLPKNDQNLIIRSVTLHNVFTLPAELDEKSLLFVRLIRDADKLDILRVVLEYLSQDEQSRAKAVGLGLPDLPDEYSREVLAFLVRRELVRKETLTTLNDFKLMQLSWLNDLNFTCSLRMIVERDYIGQFEKILPKNEEIAGAIGIVREYVNEKLRMR